MPSPVLHIIHQEDHTSVTDVNLMLTGEIGPELARVREIEAKAQVDVAEATHSKPARQKTIRSGIQDFLFLSGILIIGYAGCKFLPTENMSSVLISCALALGGFFTMKIFRGK